MSTVTQSTYDAIAPHFAEANRQMPDMVRDDLQSFVSCVSSDDLCLDLGCGTGRDMAWLENQKLRMVGADFSMGMLAEARKAVTGPLMQMDMRSLAFADSTFDGIWCNAALLHLPKLEAAGSLQEMYRILRSSAILDLAVQEGDGEILEINPYTTVGERLFARYSIDEMTTMLMTAGFSILDTRAIESPRRNWLRFVAKSLK